MHASRITSWPGARGELADFPHYAEDRVVVDGPFITSRGPGTSVPFALALVRQLFGADAAAALAADTVALS